MTNLPWIPYVLVLFVAFAIGLAATVAASRVVAAPLGAPQGARPTLEQPANATPAPQVEVPTIEC